MDDLAEAICHIARGAGDIIMSVYNSDDFDIQIKAGNFPVTRADKAADKFISDELKKISNLPVISEEGESNADVGDEFWLVDPLDGTREFIDKNGEFTVNIGLIKNGKPAMGVVYAPAISELYVGTVGEGAYKQSSKGAEKLSALFQDKIPIVVVSRSHKDETTTKLLKKIGKHQEIKMGSSMKLCLVAEGRAMLYPRLAPTYLWDTAAADAVVRAAGGTVQDLGGNELVYDPKISIKNPYFVVATKNTIDWQTAIN